MARASGQQLGDHRERPGLPGLGDDAEAHLAAVRCGVDGRRRDGDGPLDVALDEVGHPARHRERAHDPLRLRIEVVQDPLHVREPTQALDHLGLIDDDDADVGERERPLGHRGQHVLGRREQDVGALRQDPRGAERRHGVTRRQGDPGRGLREAVGAFPGRAQHQEARRSVVHLDSLQESDAPRHEKPAPRTGGEHEVVGLAQHRDGGRLKRGGPLDALRGERLDELVGDAEVFERLHGRRQDGSPEPGPPSSPGSYGSRFRKRCTS